MDRLSTEGRTRATVLHVRRIALALAALAGTSVVPTSAAVQLSPSQARESSALQLSGASFFLELEGGPLWQSRNDVQIPNDSGTRFALDGLTGRGPFAAVRVYAEARFGRRHSLRLLAAPLSLSGSGVPDAAIEFAEITFVAGTPIEATYRFDSYRVTYRYRVADYERWHFEIGLTAKIRDAEVRLEQNQVIATNTNTGFVPLLHASTVCRFGPGWALLLDADAAAAPQGRAFDVAVKAVRALSDRWAVSAGYRTLEGGADVETVYTFAWFHYAVFSVSYRT